MEATMTRSRREGMVGSVLWLDQGGVRLGGELLAVERGCVGLEPQRAVCPARGYPAAVRVPDRDALVAPGDVRVHCPVHLSEWLGDVNAGGSHVGTLPLGRPPAIAASLRLPPRLAELCELPLAAMGAFRHGSNGHALSPSSR